MAFKRIYISFLLAFFVQLSFAQKQQGRPAPKEANVPEGIHYEVKHYREGAHPRASELSIAYKDDGKRNKPVVVFIHGGGWANGDNDQVVWQMFKVAQQGFVGVGISYRLISEAAFPTCIYDVKEAIRYLKTLQSEIPIDTERIGVWGYSAGAHLALMIGLTPEDAFKSDAYSEYDSAVKALMVVAAPTDFVTRVQTEGDMRIFSKSQNKDKKFQEEVAPLSYIHKEQLPIYMLHGTADGLVKPYHYQNFEQQCKKEGVSNFKLFEFEDGGHMFLFKRQKEVLPVFKEFLKSI